MEVDEEKRLPWCHGHGLCGGPADDAPQVREATESLRRAEKRSRMWQRFLPAAHQRLEPQRGVIRRAYDGLVGHPQRRERTIEVGPEFGSAPHLPGRFGLAGQRVPLRHCPAVQNNGALDDLRELRHLERLGEIEQRTELRCLHCSADIRRPGDEHHWEFGLALAHFAKELQPVEARHLDVAHHDVEASAVELFDRFLARGRFDYGVAEGGERASHHAAQRGLVVHHQHPADDHLR